MTTEGLDKIDYKILSVMQHDASLSAAEIADLVGLSKSPCWRRIERLKDEGYITRVVALLDRHKLGLRAQMFVQIKIVKNDQSGLAEFSKAIRAFPEVMDCHVVLGVFDFLLRVVTEDMDAYEKFYFEKLSRIPQILEVTSFVAASEIKAATEWPLQF